ncbi:uncharacterized protein V1516DRAFT_678397 [Lipomyces oligophaga]|uniref:uncharacterized protein n=1 Tax=Lipomyces oligophaga TaxID=45792 RepID=UPI0034CDD75C
MPIKLLKHKSYHVYRQDNIDRVRKDEEQAKAKRELQEDQRQTLDRAEQLRELRRRQGNEIGYEQDNKHEALVNLQAKLEEDDRRKRSESRQHRSKGREDVFGELAKDAPWYTKNEKRIRSRSRSPEISERKSRGQINTERAETWAKNNADPLTDMRGYLEQKSRADEYRREREARQHRMEFVERGSIQYYTGTRDMPGVVRSTHHRGTGYRDRHRDKQTERYREQDKKSATLRDHDGERRRRR